MAEIIVLGPPSIFRSGLVSLLGTIGFDSIGEMDSVKQLEEAASAKPTLVICWARSADQTFVTVSEVRAWDSTAKVLVVTPTLDLDVMRPLLPAPMVTYWNDFRVTL